MAPQSSPEIGGNLGTKIITIFVGPDHKKFRIHKDLLCRKSLYFSSFLAPVYFEYASAEMFSIFVTWLYKGSIDDSFHGEQYVYDLIDLYVFALDTLCLEALANDTIDCIQILVRDHQDRYPMTPEVTDYVYSRTLSGSELRKLCVHALATELCDPDQERLSTIDRIKDLRDITQDGNEFFIDYLIYLTEHEDDMYRQNRFKKIDWHHTQNESPRQASPMSQEESGSDGTMENLTDDDKY